MNVTGLPPEEGASGAPRYLVPALRPTPLQRLWLREIGIDKVWQPAARASAAATATSAVAAPAEHAVGQGRPEPQASVTPAAKALAGAAAAPTPHSDAPEAAPAATRAAAPVRKPGPSAKPAAAPVVATPSAPAIDTAALAAKSDFDELREHVLACTACGLCQSRRQAVYGVGSRAVRWLVVGEAPGEQEDRQGEPFVGRSGQLLDAMLASVGLSRERDVFIANVIKCRPPGNRNPRADEIAACSPYLLRQIELLKPERILVLGRFAAQTLLQTDGSIATLRGRVHTLATPDGRQVPLVVSYHPAYLLRSPLEKARAWQDLRLAVSLS